MHKAKNPTHIAKALPRMSWSPANLYNLYQRTYGPPTADTRFTKSSMTLFQQKWKAKQLVRGYHGDFLPEQKFKKYYLPDGLPPIVGTKGTNEPKVPLASLMFAEVEKRLDTVVFRCCFAYSVYAARQMVLHGKVTLNGQVARDPNTKLQPGDLISVEPSAVVTLQSRGRKSSAAAASSESPSSSSDSPAPPADAAPSETPASESDSAPSTPAAPVLAGAPSGPRPLPFRLPDFASPFLFIPPYLEPSFSTCSAVYLRHPTARPGVSEVPSPYEADGEVMRLAWEYYTAMGRKGDKRPASQRGKRLGA
ncbi:mitochondrial 37S ribosomal protein uS4m NAM9 [Rhodotorula paludigena]|uniref:mitochondrial 37S ribosomal protein uS4m NAM9 n=1 Tax=Rhodotorula paludigena TaxID=86838 RepID=UPI00316CAE72